MQITLVGPGRAGTAVALAALAAGHEIVAVMARRADAAAEAADRLASTPLALDSEVPRSDLVLVAVRDDALADVAEVLAGSASSVGAAVHLSGLAGIDTLDPLSAVGVSTGSFHPLQTLPTPEAGAARLSGAWVAITTEDDALRAALTELARSIGSIPFDLDEDAKPIYHAAAAAAANFPLAALTMASDLFEKAGVPFEAAEPLVSAVVANAFSLGPRAALTGPVARGDVGTVAGQLAAIADSAPEWDAAFRSFVAHLAKLTGRHDQFAAILESDTR